MTDELISDDIVTGKAARFVEEYCIDQNGLQAVLRAGYDQSPEVAAVTANKLLKKGNVKKAIQAILAEKTREAGTSTYFVLRELFTLANLNIADALDEHGHWLPLHDMPVHVQRSIASIEFHDPVIVDGKPVIEQCNRIKKIKFHPKKESLDSLAKYHKLFVDEVNHTGKVTLEELVAGSKKEEEKKE